MRGNIPRSCISETVNCTMSMSSTCCCPSREPYVMDRGYIDFEWPHRLHEAGSFFVARAKSNLYAQRRYSHPVDRSTGLMCDQTIMLTGFYSCQDFAMPLRRIHFKNPVTGKRLMFLTNNVACRRSPSPSCIDAVGRSSSFSNGSSGIFVSTPCLAHPITPSSLNSGLRSRCTCSSPSLRNASTSPRACMKCYRY